MKELETILIIKTVITNLSIRQNRSHFETFSYYQFKGQQIRKKDSKEFYHILALMMKNVCDDFLLLHFTFDVSLFCGRESSHLFIFSVRECANTWGRVKGGGEDNHPVGLASGI